jgi:hypothetical protein
LFQIQWPTSKPALDAKKGEEQSDSKESDEKDDDSSIMVNDFQGESFDIGQTIDL